MEEYGVEKLKAAGLVLVEFGMKLEEALSEDSPKGKKVSLAEAISLGVFIAPKAIGLAGDAEVLKNEFQDLSAVEIEEIQVYIAEQLDLENDLVETLLEAGLEWAVATNNLRIAVQDVLRKE
jgi:phosphoglycolate phosphatase-like HAD superfamily hydrolase